MIPLYTYLNGRIIPSTQAVLPVTDRGISMGDGLFETISIYNGHIYKWQWHKERLQLGLETLGFVVDTQPLHNAIYELLKQCNTGNCLARITVTRGTGGVGYLPPEVADYNVIITLRNFPESLSDAATLMLSKWKHNGMNIKTTSAIASVMARREAADNGCFEAVMTGEDGVIAECSSANIFWVKNGVVYTPDESTGIIRGIMRKTVINLLNNQVIQGRYKASDLLMADEVFITNVARGIMPVSRFMNKDYNSNLVALRLAEMLNDSIAEECTP